MTIDQPGISIFLCLIHHLWIRVAASFCRLNCSNMSWAKIDRHQHYESKWQQQWRLWVNQMIQWNSVLMNTSVSNIYLFYRRYNFVPSWNFFYSIYWLQRKLSLKKNLGDPLEFVRMTWQQQTSDTMSVARNVLCTVQDCYHCNLLSASS